MVAIIAVMTLFAVIIPSTTIHAASGIWNYGRESSYSSPYSLAEEGDSEIMVTFSTDQGLVSGNRGYTTRIVSTSASKDLDIATQLGITVEQLKQLRFAVVSAQMLFEAKHGPNRTTVDLRLPEATKKRLIGPDFVQNLIYAVLHRFNPVRYEDPLIWPDFVPNLNTMFTDEELDYFLAGSIAWSDSISSTSSYYWGLADFCLTRMGHFFSSSASPSLKKIQRTGGDYSQPHVFEISESASCGMFSSDNPLTAVPLFDVTLDMNAYLLRNSESSLIYAYPRTPAPLYISRETLTSKPGNQTQYSLSMSYKSYVQYWLSGTLKYSIALPDTTASINGGANLYLAYADIGDAIDFRSKFKPDSGIYLYFSERPDWVNGGTESQPIPIRTVAELETMLSYGGNKHFRLMNNIDVGGNSLSVYANTFSGVFDGDGHTISNYRSNNFNGLFDAVTGTIKNLSVRNAKIRAGYAGGSIARSLGVGGVIENCCVIDIEYDTAAPRLGGVVGTLSGGTIRDCTVMGGTIYSNAHVGGIAGAIDGAKGGTIERCQVLGLSIRTNDGSTGNAGGIAGYIPRTSGALATTTIDRCEVDAATTILALKQAGGIVGNMVHGSITNCVANPTMTPTGMASLSWGGIAGGASESGATGVISRCRSGVTFNLGAYANTSSYVGGILGAASVTATSLTIEDCEGAATYVLGASNANGSIAGIAALNGQVSISRCLQTTPIVASTGKYNVAGILIGGGTMRANVVVCGTIGVATGSADIVRLPVGTYPITAIDNRYADTVASASGVSSPTIDADAVNIADLQGAAHYGPPYDFGPAWQHEDFALPRLHIEASQGAEAALRELPTGITRPYGYRIAYMVYELDGVRIDASQMRDGNGDPLVDGTYVSSTSPMEVHYATNTATATAGDRFFRVTMFQAREKGYSGRVGSGYEGWPDFFDGVGVRVRTPPVSKSMRLKIVQAGENFYARPDGGTCTVEEFDTVFAGTALQTWTLQPGHGLDEIPIQPNHFYRLTDTVPPTEYIQRAATHFMVGADGSLDKCDELGNAEWHAEYNFVETENIAVQEDASNIRYVYTKHNKLTSGDTDDEVRRVTIQADTSLYTDVDGATFDLYMFPDLTFTSTPRFLRNVKISRGAIQDPTPLFPAYYQIVQKTAPAGHTVESAPIYFALNGSGGVLKTSTHALNPEMRGTQPSSPIIYLTGNSGVRVHVRTLIVDDAYPNGLIAPTIGHAHIDGYDPVGLAMQDVRRNIYMRTGFESMGIEYTDYALPTPESAYPEYAITPIIPQYFAYRGYVVTTQVELHRSTALTSAGAFARLDPTQGNEFWVTFFIEPTDHPGNNALDVRTNEFGELDLDAGP